MFITLLSAVMQSDIPGCVGLTKTPAQNTLCPTCQDVCCAAVRANTRGLVFLRERGWMHSVLILLVYCCCQCVCLHAHVFFSVHRAPKVSWHWCQETGNDKQTMPGGGFKQCAAIALLLSVCPRCRVTEVFSAIKVFSMLQHCVCVCVCLLWQRLPCDWLYWTCSNKAKHTTGAASN